MAFRVIAVQRQRGPQFKVMFEWWENTVRKYRAVPRSDWPRHGFSDAMSLDEAKARKDSLNAKEKLSRNEARRQKILARLDKERLEQVAYLPEALEREFVTEKLPPSPKTQSHWAAARRVLTATALPPECWADSADKFYKEFVKRQMSPSYLKKVLPLINRWGAFQSRKQQRPFDPIPFPPKHWANEIAETHYQKTSTQGGRESAPLPPEFLTDVDLDPEALRWLQFSVWFGLRPVEIDLLAKPSSKKTWWVSRERVPVLWIYQTKLKGVAPDKRVKYVPAFLPEQAALLKDMSLPVKRPGRKKMISLFGESITLYGGRKNFIQLMKSHGQKFENVSVWMGHTDLKRTYQSYFNKQVVTFDPAP
jgi:hypothetical protein